MSPVATQELAELDHLLDRLRRGEWDRSTFRAQSVHFGVYTQRQADQFFVRVRVPLGILTGKQVRALASAAAQWAGGECHLTTRQGIEIHGLAQESILPLLSELAEVDLFSHETGGSSVRSVMLCPHAGVGAEEPFDVTCYAEAVAKHFVRHPEFQSLPRKIKIGFSCCDHDCARTAVQDLGFQARTDTQGQHGFRVVIGGGTGALPRLAQELVSFLPATRLMNLTEAFLRTFNRLGNRENRSRARVKFLVQSLGLERLREEILGEMRAIHAQGRSYPAVWPTALRRSAAACQNAPDQPPSQAVASWIHACTTDQRQAGFRMIQIPLPGGSLNAQQLQTLADLSERLALELRLTPDQEILLRWAPAHRLTEIHETLSNAALVPATSDRHVLGCPGSSGCTNAFTNAPALLEALRARLATLDDPGSVLGRLSLRVSGCTNGCALHAICDLGLEGVANRRGDEWFPGYRLWLGGRQDTQRPSFGADLGIVPSRLVPDCAARVLAHYLEVRQNDESPAAVLDRLGLASFREIVRRFQFEQASDRRSLMIDWGETTAYRPRMSSGTC